MMQLPTPCIFAHRGASGDAPENTISSFQLAVTQGAHAVELDAKLSSDGEIVVIHDRTLKRTTDGDGYIHQTTYANLRSLDAGSWFSEKYAGEKIPLLEEVLEAVAKQVFVNIEVTNYKTPRDILPFEIAKLVKRMGLDERVLFSSFLPRNLQILKDLLPNTPVALLTEPKIYFLTQWLGIAKRTSPEIQHPYHSDVNETMLKKAHEQGKRIHTWTVNKEVDMKRLFAMGVDGVFTDYPAVALELLKSNGAS
jgi:glycerophosphoryl diester phosphodiesterase